MKTKRILRRALSVLTAAVMLAAALFPCLEIPASAAALTINTAEDLIKLASDCVSDTYSASLNVKLGADIDLESVNFRPIPLFAGSFDGCGHKITGLSLTGAASYAGLFRQLLPGSSVTSLTVEGSVTGLDGAEYIGGIAGLNRGVISGCEFKGSVTGGNSTGGICGAVAAEGVVEDCEVSGSVRGGRRTGGIAGDNAGTVRGCLNSAEVAGTPEQLRVESLLETLGIGGIDAAGELGGLLGGECDTGGIAGRSTGTVRDCVNSGSVGRQFSGANVGGICGICSGYLENCKNSGRVRGSDRVGGIVGRSCPDFNMTFESGTAAELKDAIDSINSSVNSLVFQLALKGFTLSAQVSGLVSSVTDAEQAVDQIIEDLREFANGNIEAVNAISERINDAVSGLSGILNAFAGAADGISESFSSLSGVLSEAAALSELNDNVFDRVTAANDAALRSAAALAEKTAETASKIAQIAEGADPEHLSELLEELKGLLPELRELLDEAAGTLAQLKDSAVEIYDALYLLRDAGEHITAALELASRCADDISSSVESVADATRLAAKLADDLSAAGAVQFTLFKENPEARNKLLGALEKINNHVIKLSDEIGSLGLGDSLTNISDNVKLAADLIVDTFESVTHPSLPSIEDISEKYGSDKNRRSGRITGCENTGFVSADGSAGGIAGSVSLPLEYDPSVEIDFFALFTGGSEITVFSLIDDCVNEADVEVRKSSAGGIAGDAKFGYITGCSSRGKITAGVSYAGGIAGRTEGGASSCRANVSLDCPLYAGGIAGQAELVSGSMALPYFIREADYAGAIAGNAASASGNSYAECDIGAINGFTFAREATLLTFNELLVNSGADPLFVDVRVTFDAGDGSTATVTVRRGGKVAELPVREPDEGAWWVWFCDPDAAYYRDTTVRGAYNRPSTLASASEAGAPPEYLAEGTFFPDGAVLSVTAVDPPASLARRTLKAAQATVDGYNGDSIRMHVRADGRCRVYLFTPGGEARETESSREGSYLIFDMANGSAFAIVRDRRPLIIAFSVAAGAIVLAGAAAALIISARKKKKSPSGHKNA